MKQCDYINMQIQESQRRIAEAQSNQQYLISEARQNAEQKYGQLISDERIRVIVLQTMELIVGYER